MLRLLGKRKREVAGEEGRMVMGQVEGFNGMGQVRDAIFMSASTTVFLPA